MHLTQLQYFLEVVRFDSISAAAEALFVSQSAVSKQILMLEKELGFPLFDRGYRQIRLTDNDGNLLLAYDPDTKELTDQYGATHTLNR